jgi:O-antigen ligase
MVLLLPMVFALPACIKSVGTLRTSLGFCLALMAYQATFASLHGGRGTGAQFTDENDLSLFVNTYLPFAFCLFMGEKRFRVRVFYFMTIVAGVAGVVASRSRGGFVGLVAIGAVIWLVSRRKILALVVVALVAFGLVQFASDAYWARMATSTEADAGTGKERIESWKSGWNMFLDNPLGVGGNNFQVRFPDYQTEYFRRGMWGRVAHSLWLTVVAELGIPGAAIYLVLLVANVRACFRLRHIGQEVGGDNGRLLVNIGSAMLASMVGFFASATFLSVLYYAHYWYLTGFIVAASEIAQSLRESGPSQLATTA